MRYRPDIDGLRAVAVLPVVLFHAGFDAFSGGFVGVDIFFVISGYLITSFITEELQYKQFSIVSFYERRIRRIFPALFVVVFFSSVAASYLLFSPQFYDFAKSVLATTLFTSNILFWHESGYFAAPASEKPLLHTWSLAVEEQFYILFPLFLFVVHRWLRARFIALLVPITTLSFAISVWGVANKPSATFYMAPTRAWELLLGSLLAVGAFPHLRNRLLRQISSIAGLGLIAWSIFYFSRETPFPGASALFPCVGAALVIYSGDGGPSAIGNFLSLRPIVFIGLISYSLYLWHWPLLLFAQDLKIFELTAYDKSSIIGLSFLAAILSWKFVEMPFRRRGIVPRNILFFGAAGTMACAASFGLFGYLSEGWPSRIPERAAEIAAYSSSINPRRSECLGTPEKFIAVADACSYGANVTPKYAVWGDSHADALVPGIAKIADQYNEAIRFFGMRGCPPIAGWGPCLNYNAQAITSISDDHNIHTVILIARYELYLDGRDVNFGPAEANNLHPVTDERGPILTLAERKALFTMQLSQTVDRLIMADKSVALVYPIPETGYDIPQTLAQMIMVGINPSEFTRPVDYYRRRQKFIFSVLDKLGNSDKIIRIYPHRRLCDDERCIVFVDGKPLYHDSDHLSLVGADFIATLFQPIFKRELVKMK